MCDGPSVKKEGIFDGKPVHLDEVKNITRSNLLQKFKAVISEVSEYFQANEPESYKETYEADYSEEKNLDDFYENLDKSQQNVRVKAVVNFKPTNHDELGFQKNDIITICSMKDEHCWTGQLDGRNGWFPSKFVKVIDERTKKYSQTGDGHVNKEISRLIRSKLCRSLSDVLEHGLKPSLLMTSHVWQFIEQVSSYEATQEYSSVISRLVLCKTFRLDDEGKVLTPEELLFRCVEAINKTHSNEHMDVKFRSFVCYGLNEQVLHLWWEIMCNCEPVAKRWYHIWSFVASPAWVQVKCELRVLNKFTFYLPVDEEVNNHSLKAKASLRKEVSDMLVKHHLFSWDL